MLNSIPESKDPAKAWKESQSIRDLFWVLQDVDYPSLINCQLYLQGGRNCSVCATLNHWTADDVREWIPEFPL